MNENILGEYQKLINEYEKEIVINDIKILSIQKCSFNNLLDSELEVLHKTNLLLEEQIKAVDSLETLLIQSIEAKRCKINIDSKGLKGHVKNEIESDSILMKSFTKKSICLKIEKLENNIKIKKLIALSHKDFIDVGDNFKIKHEILYKNDDLEIIRDTLYFLSFLNEKLSYLNRNIIVYQ